jgi:hypothetical protein
MGIDSAAAVVAVRNVESVVQLSTFCVACCFGQSAWLGKRSSYTMAKRLSASFQPRTVSHFLASFLSARYMTFKAASSLGNAPRVLMALRKLMLSDSMALGVYTILRISSGNWKKGMMPSQLRRYKALIDG